MFITTSPIQRCRLKLGDGRSVELFVNNITNLVTLSVEDYGGQRTELYRRYM